MGTMEIDSCERSTNEMSGVAQGESGADSTEYPGYPYYHG
jgi:hypothetical protein